MYLRVLVIGGIDPSGGAGITADARTLQLHGAMALPVATALTVQNRFGLQAVAPVGLDAVQAALGAAVDDGPVQAIKVGLLASAEQVEGLAAWLRGRRERPPLVVDPVLSATAGGYAADPAIASAYRRYLAPIATVFTPNGPELSAVLVGAEVRTLLTDGCGAVLHKGGHGLGDRLVDRLVLPEGEQQFAHPRLPVGPVHGTGCALASSIAAGLAGGRPVTVACAEAIGWLQRCLGAMGPAEPRTPPRPLLLLGRPVR